MAFTLPLQLSTSPSRGPFARHRQQGHRDIQMPLDLPLPEHCSLLQAALWVARGQRPVPDEVFEAAPLWLDDAETEPDGPLRPLLQALRAGAIPARTIWVLETAPHPLQDPWERRHVSPSMDLPPSSWNWSGVNWN